MTNFYVYIHRKLSDNKPFYVGKGSGNRAWDFHRRNSYWNNVKNKHGIIVEIVFENLTEEEAFQCEKDTILEFKYFGYPLTNMTNGGEGPAGFKFSDYSKYKMSISQKNSNKSKLARENTAKKLKGKCLSIEHKICISNSLKNKKKSDSHRIKAAQNKRCRKLYLFVHSDESEFEGSREDFEIHSKLTRRQVSMLFGNRPNMSVFGWSLKLCII